MKTTEQIGMSLSHGTGRYRFKRPPEASGAEYGRRKRQKIQVESSRVESSRGGAQGSRDGATERRREGRAYIDWRTPSRNPRRPSMTLINGAA